MDCGPSRATVSQTLSQSLSVTLSVCLSLSLTSLTHILTHSQSRRSTPPSNPRRSSSSSDSRRSSIDSGRRRKENSNPTPIKSQNPGIIFTTTITLRFAIATRRYTIFLLLTRIQLSGYRSDFQGLFTSSQSLVSTLRARMLKCQIIQLF
nr:uncharacterized protein LOC103448819 [Malus domestica]